MKKKQPECVTHILPPSTREYVLGLFHAEFVGNMKHPTMGLTIDELTELANLYPEIWGEYVRKFNEHSTQSNQPEIPFGMGSDQMGWGQLPAEVEIEPSFGWGSGDVGYDTPIT